MRVTGIANRHVLAQMQREVTATGAQNKCAVDGRRPDNVVIHEPPEMLEDWIALIARLLTAVYASALSTVRYGPPTPAKRS